MTYNPQIPQAADLPSASQPQLLVNFQQLNTIFGADHYPFDNAVVALRGKHQFVTLEHQAAGPATAGTQVALYSKDLAGTPTLYFRRPGSGTEVQMTNNANPVQATTGQSFLPGGMIIRWGQFTMVGSPFTYTYPPPLGAFPTNTICVLISPFLGGPPAVIPVVQGWTNTNFTVAAAPGQPLTYIAIGF